MSISLSSPIDINCSALFTLSLVIIINFRLLFFVVSRLIITVHSAVENYTTAIENSNSIISKCVNFVLTRKSQNPPLLNLFRCVSPFSDVKTILKNVSGQLKSGELTGIMGPSGAGKSTLLNILSGYKASKFDGMIAMNGTERNLSVFRKLSAYIMQDNQLHLNLTVEEAMNVAANLKLSRRVLSAEKWNVVSVRCQSQKNPHLIPS